MRLRHEAKLESNYLLLSSTSLNSLRPCQPAACQTPWPSASSAWLSVPCSSAGISRSQLSQQNTGHYIWQLACILHTLLLDLVLSCWIFLSRWAFSSMMLASALLLSRNSS